jgi:hypothetical protein
MSTNNFSYENICVVVHSPLLYGCDTCEIEQKDSSVCTGCGGDMYDYTDENIQSDIDYYKNTLEQSINDFSSTDKKEWYNNYLLLGKVILDRLDSSNYTVIYVTYNPGYYNAACLDYTVDRIIYEDDSDKQAKEEGKRILSKCKEIEKVLRTFGTEIKKVGQFSNGEAVYKLVDNKQK